LPPKLILMCPISTNKSILTFYTGIKKQLGSINMTLAWHQVLNTKYT
jgi:hypothetical protein